MARLNGKSRLPGNMNAFKHGLAAIQKRRERGVSSEHEKNVRQQILDGLIGDGACFRQPQNLRVKRRGDLMFHKMDAKRFSFPVAVYQAYFSEISIKTPSGSEN
jgi:hypothetical protein